MLHLGHRQLEHLPLGRIRQRVLSQFWLGFADPWDILTQIQAVCLWGQSCEGLWWCHIASSSHRLSPSQRRDQLPVASEQRHPGDLFQGSPCGRSCYNVFWNHTGFCLVSCVFRNTRLSGHLSCTQELCIDSWSVQWVSEGVSMDWIGLDLFNDETRPSGHISRPTQVNVSELVSFSKQLLNSYHIVQSGG